MTPILRQFVVESREFLQAISEKLLSLERAPDDTAGLTELFRAVHTLKGNSGLFEFPEMTRVLHAAEDLMSVVRDRQLPYRQDLADRLFEAMDFVSLLLDEIESEEYGKRSHAPESQKLAEALRALTPAPADAPGAPTAEPSPGGAAAAPLAPPLETELDSIPGALREAWEARIRGGGSLVLVAYVPEADCFFKGEDPFHQARQTPGTIWQRIRATGDWPALDALDPYQCKLRFTLVSTAGRGAIETHFRYVPEQITLTVLRPGDLVPAAPVAAGCDEWRSLADSIIRTQIQIFGQPPGDAWSAGRLRAASATLAGCLRATDRHALIPALETALAVASRQSTAAPLQDWATRNASHWVAQSEVPQVVTPVEAADPGPPRRTEESVTPRTLKVDQQKIDRLMNLIGEMVVAKNGLPFLASRAESVFGVRELAREIKTQYAVINRIASEMQDSIMQVRMLPVSFVFQRFPRLVRDIARKLGKEVELVLEGEDTEADKNIIEALADPLIHVVRNSLDHGLESPEARRAAGKPPVGRLVIRATQESDRVVIDISDDGRGIDPAAIKAKAYANGLIDEATLERISDAQAIDLIFAPGLSTAAVVSDLSGRGVGMDVVRSAIHRVNGSIALESTLGQGTRLRLSLPLSMAVTNVMVIESNQQIYGVPMDMVLETVRVPRASIRSIKNRQATVLRNRIMPLRSLNQLLASDAPQKTNDDDELATLVVRIQGEQLGIVVDDFREVIDIILKPMSGILGGLTGYSGSALLGDGSVLMVLNPTELVTWQ